MNKKTAESIYQDFIEQRINKEDLFKQIVSLFKVRLYWHIRKIVLTHSDADDVLQNTFIKVWQNVETFKGESALYTWLYRISTNEALAMLKKKKRANLYSIDEADTSYVDELVNDPYFYGDELLVKLHQAIASLPSQQRAVFNLKYFEDLKYSEIEAILNTSVGALKASYHHAVKKIKSHIKKNMPYINE